MPIARIILWLSSGLFCIGIYGVLTRKHAVGILLCIEIILNAAALNFVLFSQLFGQIQGQAFALFVIALAACEAAVGLAIIVSLSRSAKTVFVDRIDLLRG